jgi:hypothetical protein
MMARRLPVLVACALTLAGLVACTGNPVVDDSVVAKVGDVEITEEEVDAVADDLRQELGGEIENELAELADEVDEAALADHRERRYGELEDQVSVTRTRVIEMKILTEATAQYLTEEVLQLGEQERAVVADDLGLPPDNGYVEVVAEFFMHLNRLQAQAQPAEPTEEDLHEVYDHLQVRDKPVFSEARETLMQAGIEQPLGMRNLLLEVLDQVGVEVNPSYNLVYQVPVPVGGAQSWVGVPLGDSAVVDG